MNKIVKLSLSVFLALGLVSVNANSHAFVGVGVAQKVKNTFDKHEYMQLPNVSNQNFKNAQGIKASVGYGVAVPTTDFGVDVSFDYQYNLESDINPDNYLGEKFKMQNHLIYITPGVNYNIMGGTYGTVFVKMGFGYNIQDFKFTGVGGPTELKNDFAVKVSTGYEYTIAEMHAIAVDYTYSVSYFRTGFQKNYTTQTQTNNHEIGLGYKFKLAI